MFQTYKYTLPSYSKVQLTFPSVSVKNVEVNAGNSNIITTFWKTNYLEMSEGINFGKKVSVKCQYQHIDHEPFSYAIAVENSNFAGKQATVRIFMAAKHDELGNPIPLDEQRRLMIELDKFKVDRKYHIYINLYPAELFLHMRTFYFCSSTWQDHHQAVIQRLQCYRKEGTDNCPATCRRRRFWYRQRVLQLRMARTSTHPKRQPPWHALRLGRHAHRLGGGQGNDIHISIAR